jgi:hypothetical protein
MPTIDDLAPATAASDTDELLVSQAGITRKITRAQTIAGLQQEIALPSMSLLGRSSAGTGPVETLTLGGSLILNSGTLYVTESSFDPTQLAPGEVPSPADLVPITQGGTTVAITFSQFASGVGGVPNIDVTQAVVTPTGATVSQKLGDLASTMVSTKGGSLVGPLWLAGPPSTGLEPATKDYVDLGDSTALAKAGGSLTGPLLLSSDPIVSAQAATKSYVDGQVGSALPKAGGTLSGSLTLAADPVTTLQAATKQYADGRVARAGDTLLGPLILAGIPSAPLQAATKSYVDLQLQAALSTTGGTLTGALMLASDPAWPVQAATKNYVDNQVSARLSTSGGSLSGALTLPSDPTSSLQATTKQYVDTRVASLLPQGGGTLTGPLITAGSPTIANQVANKQYVDTQLASALPTSGGTMTGTLTLSSDPKTPLQPSTKQYVDTTLNALASNVKLSPFGAQLNGTTDDTASFVAAYQAAPTGSLIHVPAGMTVLQSPSSWNVALTKPVKWIVDGTTLPDGTSLSSAIPTGGNPASIVLPGIVEGFSSSGSEFSRGTSTTNDLAVLHSSYVVNHTGGASSVISNNRSDTIIYNSPNNYVWGGLDRLIWAGTQTPNATTAAQHVARYLQTVRQTIGTNSTGSPLPQPQLWSACLEYRDATGKPSSWANASLTVEMDWIGNGADDAKSRQIQSLVVSQHDHSGAAVEISSVIGIYLGGGSTGRAYRVFNVNIPFSTSILDTTGSQQLTGAAAIRMAAGHAIAFEPTASNTLSYDSSSGTLRWTQGSLFYTVGKGITVGWANVCTSNTTLPSYLSGNIIFLLGTATFTISLPTAATTPIGTGFTFSVLGSCTVSITPAGSDTIDNGPITLRQSDRYHIVSDGSSCWREVFRTNAVSPRFTAPPVLPSYTVAALPASPAAGAKAFVSNGRKPTEAAGAGTGVEVFFDGSHWISVCSGASVAA